MQKDELGLNYGANKEITDGNYDASLAVKCENGTFVGRDFGGYVGWLGIPFAKPPIGELRWEKPVPCDSSDKIFEAYNYGMKPIQFFPSEGTGEDCLYLNVISAPGKTEEKKPVMVWIHGGGFLNEATSDNLYQGQYLVQNNPDVLFVSVEYRLGIFGFLTFDGMPGGEEFDYCGVLGIFDQLAGLKWVKENIAAFGGDPDNITVFGESAGSISTMLLPLFEESKGLFNKCIAQSGSGAYTFTKDERRFVTENLFKQTGCKSVEDMKSIPADELTKNYVEVSGGANPYSPIRDDVYVPVSIEKIVEIWAENIKGIDVLAGFTRNEARYAMSDNMGVNEKQALSFFKNSYELTKGRISEDDIAVAEKFMADYPADEEWKTYEKMYSFVDFGLPTIAHADAAADSANIWVYEFALPGQEEYAGSFHSIDVDYVFNRKDLLKSCGWDDDLTMKMADDVQKLWTSFAANGVPSIDGHEFKKYDLKDKSIIVIDREGGIRSEDHFVDEAATALMPLLPVTYWFTYDSFSLNWDKVDKD